MLDWKHFHSIIFKDLNVWKWIKSIRYYIVKKLKNIFEMVEEKPLDVDVKIKKMET